MGDSPSAASAFSGEMEPGRALEVFCQEFSIKQKECKEIRLLCKATKLPAGRLGGLQTAEKHVIANRPADQCHIFGAGAPILVLC